MPWAEISGKTEFQWVRRLERRVQNGRERGYNHDGLAFMGLEAKLQAAAAKHEQEKNNSLSREQPVSGIVVFIGRVLWARLRPSSAAVSICGPGQAKPGRRRCSEPEKLADQNRQNQRQQGDEGRGHGISHLARSSSSVVRHE
jgi:hypothetical protein